MLISNSPLIIVGMHRSGTSFLTRVLMDAGYFFGEYKDGNNESYAIININDKLLQSNGSIWYKPNVVESEVRINYLLTLLKHFGSYRKPLEFLRNLSSSRWGWKDPRNTFTLPFWIKRFPNSRIIHIYRNGFHAAESLRYRNALMNKNHFQYVERLNDFHNCFNLWEAYVDQAFSYKETDILHLKYEDLIEGDILEIGKVEKYLSVDLLDLFRKRTIPNESKISHKDLSNRDFIMLKESKWMKRLGYMD